VKVGSQNVQPVGQVRHGGGQPGQVRRYRGALGGGQVAVRACCA